MQIDGRNIDVGLRGQPRFHGRIARIAGDVPGSVPVRINHDVDKIFIVE